MTDLLVQVAMAFLGVLLLIITGLMAYSAKGVVRVTGQMEIWKALFERQSKSIEAILVELKVIAQHNTDIAVMKNDIQTLRADVDLLNTRRKP